MADEDLLRRIHELVEREHTLERAHIGAGLSGHEHAELHEVEVALDQCWDLLRQRRARRAAGKDPSDAEVRSEGTVEHYQQ
jgi:hypothetical protein